MRSVIQEPDKVVIRETMPNRTMVITEKGCTVNGRQVETIPPDYASLVPERHPTYGVAEELAVHWFEIQQQFR